MTARDEILARVRGATRDVTTADAPVDWTYGRTHRTEGVVDLFVERVEDYRAQVVRCTIEEIPAQIAGALARHGARSVAVPTGLPSSWGDALAEHDVHTDGSGATPLTADQLDAVDAVVTAAALGVAETGTVILDHRADQGRRALTLVPDLHVCVVRGDQVVDDVPAALARLATSGSLTAGLPLTWISGPSATSDIELDRVEGVHGPRTLVVILAG